jgi:hypothetical protein
MRAASLAGGTDTTRIHVENRKNDLLLRQEVVHVRRGDFGWRRDGRCGAVLQRHPGRLRGQARLGETEDTTV